MKGDEPENKKLGCTVGLLVRAAAAAAATAAPAATAASPPTFTNFLFLFRISTNPRSTRSRCLSATSTSCVSCTCRQRTTPVQHTHTAVHTWDRCDRCVCVCVEAAFTLLLYWELLHWEERPLKELLHYPAQTEWQRKEGLSRKVIHYFNKGKVRQWNTHTHTHR